MYELTYRGWWLLGGGLLVGLCVFASLLPGPHLPALHNADKLGHALMYGAIFLWFSGIVVPRHWGALILVLLVLGGFLELLQAKVPGRGRDLWDLVANGAGLGAGLAIAYSFAASWCLKVETRLTARQGKS